MFKFKMSILQQEKNKSMASAESRTKQYVVKADAYNINFELRQSVSALKRRSASESVVTKESDLVHPVQGYDKTERK